MDRGRDLYSDNHREGEDIANDMTMYASQIREANAGGGSLPTPWVLDDLMTRYRDYYAEHTK